MGGQERWFISFASVNRYSKVLIDAVTLPGAPSIDLAFTNRDFLLVVFLCLKIQVQMKL